MSFQDIDYDSNTQLALENTISKAVQVCCTTIFFYHSALHFNEEVEYIWSKRWTSGKVVYLLTRYSGGIFLLYATASVFELAWRDYGLGPYQGNWDPQYTPWLDICIYGFLYVGPGTFIMLFAETILQMRVYALYGRTKKMLTFLILLTFVLFGFDVIQPFGFPYEVGESVCLGGECKLFHKRHDISGHSLGFPCTTRSIPISAIGWLLNAFVELLLFILVLKKSRQWKRNSAIRASSLTPQGLRKKRNHDITTIMAKDSRMYFAVMFTICLIGTILAFGTEIQTANNHAKDFIASQMNTYQTVVLTIMTILAPRLLINLRVEYYGPAGIFTDKGQMSWKVAPARHAPDHSLDETVDLDVRMTLLGRHNRSESTAINTEINRYSDC